MANVIYKKGLSKDLPEEIIEGQILVTEDNSEMFIDMSDGKRKKITDTSKPGFKTPEGGEIFNDYDNNRAFELTHAEGKKTSAGSKAFTIVGVNKDNRSYTLDSTTGLKIGDVFSVHICYDDNSSEQAEDYGKIISMSNGNVVFVDNIKCEKTFTTKDSYLDADGYDTEQNTFRIKEKPYVGTRNIGFMTHAEGYNTKALSKAAHAEGRGSIAFGSWSHAEGNKTVAHYAAHAEGTSTKALGLNSHAEGKNNTAAGSASHAEGENSAASGDYSHSEGYNTKSIGKYSHVEGWDSEAEGFASHAEGRHTFSKGSYSHSEGMDTEALGDWSHAEGYNTKAIKQYSHVEGLDSQAKEYASHAEGDNTKASGKYSHVEGWYSEAIGTASHAEGDSAKAEGWGSHAEGRGTIAKNAHSHAEGSFNNIYKTNVLNLFNGSANTAAGVTITSLGQVEFDLSVGDEEIYTHYRMFALNESLGGKTLSSLQLIFKLNTPIEFYVYALTSPNKINEPGGKTELHYQNIITEPTDGVFKFVKDNISIPEHSPYLAFKFKYIDTTDSNEKITLTYAAINDKKTIDTDIIHSIGNGSKEADRRNAFSVFKDGHAEVQIQGETLNSVVTKGYVDTLLRRIETLESKLEVYNQI